MNKSGVRSQTRLRIISGRLWSADLLSGLRFSTAVWVWLVVSTDVSLPFGPVVVDTTSYSEKKKKGRTHSAFYQNIPPPSIHEIVPKTVTYLNKRHMRTRGRARLFVVVMCHWTQTLDSLVARRL